MTPHEVLKLTEYAKKYKPNSQASLERNRHMNNIKEGEQVQQRHIDAVVVDFINFIAAWNGWDLAFYTEDLDKKNLKEDGVQ